MKLGCSSWSYHAALRAGRLDLFEWLRVCAEDLELDGAELVDLHFPTIDPVYLRDIKKRCADLQLTIAGLAVTNDFGAAERQSAEIQKVKQWCDIAAYVGAPVVRVFGGWFPNPAAQPQPGWLVGTYRRVFGAPGPNTRRLWSDMTWALRQCTDYAAERGVVLALQNNRSGGLVGTPAELAQCLHDVGSPWLRTCLDPADLADRVGVEAALATTVQTHARFRDVRDDGSDPAVHWPELLNMLRLGRYRGFVQLSYEGAEDPMAAVPRAALYLRGLLHLLDRQHLLPPPAPAGPVSDAAEDAAELVRNAFEADAPVRR